MNKCKNCPRRECCGIARMRIQAIGKALDKRRTAPRFKVLYVSRNPQKFKGGNDE